ncbi:hypothetical protein, partial [Tenacibaculum maritimum]
MNSSPLGSVNFKGLFHTYPKRLKLWVLNGSCIKLSGERKRPNLASYIRPFICMSATPIKCSCPVYPRFNKVVPYSKSISLCKLLNLSTSPLVLN